MKNKFTTFFALFLLTLMILGCGGFNPFSSKESGTSSNGPSSENGKSDTIGDKAVDVAVGEKKIGIPECDEVMDSIELELNNPDDDFISKAIKATVLNRIKDSIRESVEQNKDKDNNSNEELVKTCKEFKTQFDKFKAEQESQKSEK